MNTTVIFDIDGTLANIEHRIQWVRTSPKNWKAFNQAMTNDVPHDDIVWMLKTFKNAGSTILIASGRGEEYRTITTSWLNDVANLTGYYEKLYLRPAKDFRPDNVIKLEILEKMKADGYHPSIVVDDRQQVVDMFRNQGLRVLQVAPGDF